MLAGCDTGDNRPASLKATQEGCVKDEAGEEGVYLTDGHMSTKCCAETRVGR